MMILITDLYQFAFFFNLMIQVYEGLLQIEKSNSIESMISFMIL